ncbi:E3 ubiquitin-protein ligase TRIM39-like isoform X2 [Labeo rohita]|uniref:E3 ubiquitin-protein ligase TRIM39-like isoform X2 n=1 Tax=Labeo rohita TaxID=84645 RepID=UPI0021E1FE44|nr:E3 ubiquitin-protein ligase TRIM39-like isoform X2 [Labeo rohita]
MSCDFFLKGLKKKMAEKNLARKHRHSKDTPPSMSSSSGPLTEELKCSVCLDVFKDPVSTPCGHNFCKSCLNQCWEKSENCICPLCKEIFSKRPDLKLNTALRQVVQLYEKKFTLSKSKVLCDICDDTKMKALKSCLVCQTSYCEKHLEPHQRVLSFKKHKLMDPVENIKDYICQKHERPLDLFCRDDQMRVCVFCTDGDHRTHKTVTLEEESKEKKAQLMKTQKDVQQMILDRIRKIQDIEYFAERRKKSTEREKAANVELFRDLIRSIESCQAELLEMMAKKQKAAQKQDKKLIQELQQEITELKMRNTDVDHLLHTEDHLHLLQIDPSLYRAPDPRNWSEISMNTDVSVETLRRALTQLQETLDEKLCQSVLSKMQQYAVDVTLDPDTAHPYLILSNDGKKVRHGDIKHELPDYPERFNYSVCVLGKKGFLSGRFYFEVQLKRKTKWDLGVARESINRKGQITVSPPYGFWSLALRNGNEYCACDDPAVSLSLSVKPQKVGVFVDYEEGLVSFYDVESRSHIHSFTGQSFTNRLYPYFCPFPNDTDKDSAPMIISPGNFEFTTQI